ncbi:MAG: DUF362 domain-containing protein [Verrucomicrobiota bacterium]|nr:DUF362 domain-containing protein [Verrucomicrobiota bacterium]
MARLLAPLGGMAAFVRPGQSVLVKPNMLTDRTPDQAVTTHPAVVRAVLRLAREAGGRPRVADSPANVVKIEQVWEKTGFAALCAEEGVELVNLEKAGSKRFEVDGFAFQIARPALEADVLINCPKVKTHTLTILTGAVKNLCGTAPGFLKTNFHKLYPRLAEFGRLLAAIYKTVPPALSVADGVWGMEGEGPAGGGPIRLGFLAAFADAVALDLVLCDLLRVPRRAAPYLRPFLSRYTAPVPTVGESPLGLAPPKFRAPGILRGQLIPGPLARLLGPLIWIRPRIMEHCAACGRCARSCPTGALSQEPGRPPRLHPAECVGCCCCHEICPEKAIRMIQSRLLTLVKGKEIG